MISITKNVPSLLKLCSRLQTSFVRYSCKSGKGEKVASMDDFKKLMQKKIDKDREKITKFKKDYGKVKVADITVNQLYMGMRGMLGFVCDTSNLDANEGIRFRGYSIPEIQEKLPKAPDCGVEPLPEGIFWLLCTGDIPSEDNVAFLSKIFAEKSKLPDHCEEILSTLPKELHAMTQFSIAIACLNKDSKFNKAYNSGAKRLDYWKSVLDDSVDLLAKLPVVASKIYNNITGNSCANYDADPSLDYSANFATMLGFDDEKFTELLRLYLTIHSDHEGGNVSAHACHLVGSALADPYLSFAAGMNGLAGPLHGLANQEVLKWLDELVAAKGIGASEEDIKTFCLEFLKQPGRVIPGYGHAVLRKTDPRYICQMQYALREIPEDEMIQLVTRVYKVVPVVLQGLGKVSNPFPNVDAHSGVLLRHFCVMESSIYTVLFGVSRAMGLMAQLIWARALAIPIERPDTLSTDLLMELAKKKKGKEGGAKK